jgi:hypothetical protein
LKDKVLIVGLGSTGGYVLEFLARSGDIGELVAASRDEEWCERKTNLAKIGAGLMSHYPNISSRKIDVNDIERTAETLREVRPDIILNSTRQLKGIKYGATSFPLGAGYAMWLCLNLRLPYNLGLAIKEARIHPHVVNTTYPDAVCAVLGKLGMPPTVGVGNINHLVPRIQIAVSQLMNVHPKNVQVYMVGCHFHDISISRQGTSKGAPYLLKILVYGEDVTDRLGPEKVFSKCNIPVPVDKERNLMVASSAVRMIMAIANDSKEVLHAPGPLGLIGGYPVRVGADGVKLALPGDWLPDDAVKTNMEAMKFDGLEEIQEDGTIVFSKQLVKTFRDKFDFDCPVLTFSDWERRAKELSQKVFNR